MNYTHGYFGYHWEKRDQRQFDEEKLIIKWKCRRAHRYCRKDSIYIAHVSKVLSISEKQIK